MIRTIRGTITHIGERSLIVETTGLGYEVFSATDTLARAELGKEVQLFTHLAIRDDAQELYGFSSKNELDFFEMLLGVSGVGPRSALTIISIGSIDGLKRAIGSADLAYLTKISGIGKKTAEKIVVELRDKLAALGHTRENGTSAHEVDALEALMQLGYSRDEARSALQAVPTEILDTNSRIREALKQFGK